MWDGVEKFARYIKLDKRLSIPEKRNIACEKQMEILLYLWMMMIITLLSQSSPCSYPP